LLTPANFWALYLEKLVVLAVVLATLYFAARRLRRTPLLRRSGRLVTVLETTMLSQHAMLHVVSAGGRYFLIGSAPGGLSRIAELNLAVAPVSPVRANAESG
jgi:flagellar biogenesis protein FliO